MDSTDNRFVRGVFRSTDGGTTWELSIPGALYGITCIEFTPYSHDTVYAGIADDVVGPYVNGMLKSNNAGAYNSWYELPLYDVLVFSAACDPESIGLIWAGFRDIYQPEVGGVKKSWDGGWTWQDVSAGLHYHAVFKHGLIVQPTILFSNTSYSTAYSEQKLIFSSNKWCGVYQCRDSIYTAFSTNAGISWRRKINLGRGEFPTIAPDAIGNPCAIWQRNVTPTPAVGGGELWFSRYDGTNWTEPYLLGSFTGPFNLDVNLPSFTIDPTTNKGYVVFEWRDRYINGPNSHLCLGWCSINNPSDIQFTELEYAPNPERCEFPSITQNGNYLYIAFQREHRIFRIKWEITTRRLLKERRFLKMADFRTILIAMPRQTA